MNRLKELGADLHQEGENWNEADKLAREACEKNERIRYVPPFSDPLLWKGHATLVSEFSKISLFSMLTPKITFSRALKSQLSGGAN